MFAKITHVAIVSDEYAMLGRFYEAIFGLRPSAKPRPARAVSISDGYVGLNLNSRSNARRAGIDHFGFEVEDVSVVFARFAKKYPEVAPLKRPDSRPYAGFSTGDPCGQIFDVSHRAMENRKDIYAEEGGWQQDRYINHIALRTLHPERIAEFYAEVFELASLNRKAGDPNYYLSDGRVTLTIMPWHVDDYAGTTFTAPGMDHIGFKVESVAAVMQDIKKIAGHNFRFAPRPWADTSEGRARLDLFKRQCPFGQEHFADLDGNQIDITETDI
jgi:catechol 2,3-dioxygenase-like lactoylglutathione lyase family enzyme